MLRHARHLPEARLRLQTRRLARIHPVTSHCPHCKKPFETPEPESAARPKHFPFCSPRCKQIDLGHWFTEGYIVTRPVRPDDLPSSLGPEVDDG